MWVHGLCCRRHLSPRPRHLSPRPRRRDYYFALASPGRGCISRSRGTSWADLQWMRTPATDTPQGSDSTHLMAHVGAAFLHPVLPGGRALLCRRGELLSQEHSSSRPRRSPFSPTSSLGVAAPHMHFLQGLVPAPLYPRAPSNSHHALSSSPTSQPTALVASMTGTLQRHPVSPQHHPVTPLPLICSHPHPNWSL